MEQVSASELKNTDGNDVINISNISTASGEFVFAGFSVPLLRYNLILNFGNRISDIKIDVQLFRVHT